MKKIISALLAFSVTFALAACGSVRNGTDDEHTTTSTESPDAAANISASDGTANTSEEQTGNPDMSDMPLDGTRSLVVYFSWSGNTEKVAQSILTQTGSDIFRIEPKTPYSTDYDTVVSDAKAEKQNNARPEIKDTIPNISDYDTIYVGFPNWWGDMPMILYTFFDSYDLSGKTIALFCTSGGSGLSNTVNEVKQLEPNATVTEGLHIGSGSASAPDSAVSAWLEKIGTAN